MAGARFDGVLATKLPVDSRLSMTGLGQANRNPLVPLCAFSECWRAKSA
jgi:hypothetical protein